MGLDAVIYEDEERKNLLAHKRLGNVAQIAFLREFTTPILGAQSVVVSKILYSGTHCGDSIAVSDLEPLASELRALERTIDSNVRTFARDMLELVRTALSHDRPIHFS